MANAGTDFTCYVGEAVRLDGTASTGYIRESQSNGSASILWEMGDGSTAEDILRPAHAYMSAGTYTATLTVRNSSGASSSDSAIVRVMEISASQTRALTDTGNPETNRINLQAAIDAAAVDSRSSEIVVPAGFVANDPINLPPRSSSNYVTIRTSTDLPSNQRVTKADTAKLFKINARSAAVSAYNQAVNITPDANYYRIVGVYIERSGEYKNDVIAVDTSQAARPSHIIFDRIVIDGNGTNTVRAYAPNGTYFSLLNSSILDIKYPNTESKAIGQWSGNGPLVVVNNRLEAASINLLIGGANVSSSTEILDGLEFRSNYAWKSPDWVVADGIGKGFAVKNLFELKCGLNVVVTGNIFENNYADGQSGEGIVLKSTDDNQWSEVGNIDFRNNKVLNARAGFSVVGVQSSLGNPTGAKANHIRFFNNYWLVRQDRGNLALTPDYFEVNHNTFEATGNVEAFVHFEATPVGYRAPGLKLLNNITNRATVGSIFSSFGEGLASLNAFYSSWDVRANIFNGGLPSAYPTGNYFSSVSGQTGIDSRPVGVDSAALNAATSAAATGTIS